ncbi:30S ribosome-binding factor RbfA [Williamsoniiplasma luminosum]|uniref:Ribosome-binding factor A n=1 Tax=Williamsoniiplasma luminosum TaxID=214888 RepID=A0A2S0NJ79_9MOLU|nr:30S ribosome-binding factor RbfA [Williamsoniiplasma luminosum]AVP49068.1 MAG: 30S ribosome-binding factor RbfA [Williamsoniiplasma luminosum]
MGFNKISARKESTILRELTLILTREFSNQFLNSISIHEVRLTRDNEIAKIFYSFLAFDPSIDKESVAEELEIHHKQIRKILAGKLQMKFIPELNFVYDTSLDNANHIEEILKKVNTK